MLKINPIYSNEDNREAFHIFAQIVKEEIESERGSVQNNTSLSNAGANVVRVGRRPIQSAV